MYRASGNPSRFILARGAASFFVGECVGVGQGCSRQTQPTFVFLRMTTERAYGVTELATLGYGSITRQRRALPQPGVRTYFVLPRRVSSRVGDVIFSLCFVVGFLSCFRGHSSPSGTTRPELVCTLDLVCNLVCLQARCTLKRQT